MSMGKKLREQVKRGDLTINEAISILETESGGRDKVKPGAIEWFENRKNVNWKQRKEARAAEVQERAKREAKAKKVVSQEPV